MATHENLPAELLHRNKMPVFSLRGKIYELKSYDGYRRFSASYHRPPKESYRIILEWNGKKWSIVNHFIPYSEAEVGATGRCESDFMIRYMSDKKFSRHSQAVLNAGRDLWKAYFSQKDPKALRDKYMLNRADVGCHYPREWFLGYLVLQKSAYEIGGLVVRQDTAKPSEPLLRTSLTCCSRRSNSASSL